MAVHYFYRCPSVGPTGVQRVTFPDETVLDWLQRRWTSFGARVGSGGDWPGSTSLARAIASGRALAAPRSAAELRGALSGALRVEEHLVAVESGEGEPGLACVLFDDAWLAAHPGRAAFLTHDGFALPAAAGVAPPGRPGWVMFVCASGIRSAEPLDRLRGPYVVEGARLPGVVPRLAALDQDAPPELLAIRALLVAPPGLPADGRRVWEAFADRPTSDEAWAVFSDWMLEHRGAAAHLDLLGRALHLLASLHGPASADPVDHAQPLEAARGAAAGWLGRPGRARRPAGRDPVQISPHLLQIAPRFAPTEGDGPPWYERWLLFDDVWAAGNPDLAAGAVAFGTRLEAL